MPPIYSGEDSTNFTQLSTAIGDYAKIAIVEFIIESVTLRRTGTLIWQI